MVTGYKYTKARFREVFEGAVQSITVKERRFVFTVLRRSSVNALTKSSSAFIYLQPSLAVHLFLLPYLVLFVPLSCVLIELEF